MICQINWSVIIVCIAFFANSIYGYAQEEQGGTKRPKDPEEIKFVAKDTLIYVLKSGKRFITLRGKVEVIHKEGTLTAERVDIDLETNIVEAKYQPGDATAPRLTREKDEIISDEIRFNYKTGKGRFVQAQTKIEEGYVIGSVIKNANDKEVYIQNGIFSTCPPEHLYYYIKARKLKIVDEEEIFFSAAQLYILGIPYPVIFPFGYIPKSQEKKISGFLIPESIFRRDATRGVGFEDFGWFQYFSDYVTGSIRFDIYTSGTFHSNLDLNYKKRDWFNGGLKIGFSLEQGLEPTDKNFSQRFNFNVNLNHRQTITPFENINITLSYRTQDYFKRNSYNIDQRAAVSTTSNVNYSYKHPYNHYSLSLRMRLLQNFQNNSVTITGPDVNFSPKRIAPFAKEGKTSWLGKINISYSNQLKTTYTFNPIHDSTGVSWTEALFSPKLYEEATGNIKYIRTGLRHAINLNWNEFLPLSYVKGSLRVVMNEWWYPSATIREFDNTNNEVIEKNVFSFYTARNLSFNFSLNTVLYGISRLKIGSFAGIRHTISPSVTFSVSPNLAKSIYREVSTDTLGNTQTYSILREEVFGSPSNNRSMSLNFRINNKFEIKIVKRDTTGQKTSKILTIIDNLNLSSSYNFEREELNLAPLRVQLSSNAIPRFRLSANAQFSFYKFDENGREINEFFISSSKKLAQLRQLTISLSTDFKGGKKQKAVNTPIYGDYDPLDQTLFDPIQPEYYNYESYNSNADWRMALSFNYSWRYVYNDKPTQRANIQLNNIQFNLTPKWRFRTSFGFDIIEKKFTPSQFSLSRQMECWNMSFEISPWGDIKYYRFSLHLTGEHISNIFQKLPLLNNLKRQSKPIGKSF